MARRAQGLSLGVLRGQGEVDVLGAERVQVPGVASTAALVRCAECQRISIAGMVTAFSKSDVPRKAESRTPLGRLEGECLGAGLASRDAAHPRTHDQAHPRPAAAWLVRRHVRLRREYLCRECAREFVLLLD